MPHHSAQKKSLRQDKVRQVRNRGLRARMSTLTKRAVAAAESGDETAAQDALKKAHSSIDKAVKANALHKNTGNRRKAAVAEKVREALEAKSNS